MKRLLVIVLIIGGHYCLGNLCDRKYDDPCVSSSSNTDIHDGDAVYPRDTGPTKRAAISDFYKQFYWPNATVYFVLDSRYSNAEKRVFYEAMHEYENNTCVRFIEEANSAAYVHIFPGQNGCCSYIGRVGCGKQGLSIGHQCVDKETILHELGHVLGYFHEQSRPDRDQYIRLLTENINPLQIDNFKKRKPEEIDSRGLPYDYNSIMHYRDNIFAKAPGLKTMESIKPGFELGPGGCLSPIDIIQTNLFYQCDPNNMPPPCISVPPTPPTTAPPAIACGQRYHVNSLSPIQFSYHFAHNLNCEWIVHIPSGYKCQLTFKVDIEYIFKCPADYVRLKIGSHTFSRFCGYQTSTVNDIENKVVHVYYHTDGSNIGTFSGYTGINVNIKCTDVNECDSNPCSHSCVNTVGSYHCRCPGGWYLACDQSNCFDINECVYDNGGCGHYCNNTAGSYNCYCNDTYVLQQDGKNCSNNSVGGQSCNSNNGGCEHSCNDSNGHVICTCQPGYHLGSDQKSCDDIDECKDKEKSGCSQRCLNTAGSYVCSCHYGYSLANDNKTCNDINECLSLRPDQNCHYCYNYDGDYICNCTTGFTFGPDFHSCVDYNECTKGTITCTNGKVCSNTIGSYQCICPPGTQESNGICNDINECTSGRHSCSHNCVNTKGSYYCTCPQRMILDSDNKTCIDFNECLTDEHGGCSHSCVNTRGSYYCTCPPGLQLKSDNRTCEDINECLTNYHRCSHACINNLGSYICICLKGFQLKSDNKTCEDINECLTDEHGGCSHSCVNTRGSYYCTCPPGLQLKSDNKTCEDINECLTNYHGCSHACINNPGSYICICLKGFQLKSDNKTCEDTNECLTDDHGCSHSCVNTTGSYYCTCPSNMILSSDNRTCIQQPLDCSHTLTDASGTISLPNTNCTWKIVISDKTLVISLTLSNLQISSSLSKSCSDGYIEVFNGPDTTSVSQGKFCTGTTTITSSTEELTIKYHYNTGSTGTMTYSSIKPPNYIKSCFSLVNENQMLSLSTFPGKYTQTVNCFYYIFMNNKKPTFRLLYTDLDFTDCTSDYLTVYSGLATKIDAICNSQGQTEYTSTSTIMKIEYKGTTLSKYRGFHGIIITK